MQMWTVAFQGEEHLPTCWAYVMGQAEATFLTIALEGVGYKVTVWSPEGGYTYQSPKDESLSHTDG